MITEDAKTRTRRYRGVSYTKPIDAAKKAVHIVDLAERLTGPGVRRGREIAFRCPLHDDHDPSLRVDPDKGVWFCDPCLLGGDVVELARLAWGYDEREAHVAAVNLLHEFGHEIPQRSPAWFRKQQRQKPINDAIEETIKRNFRRRAFKYIVLPCLQLGHSPAEREAEIAGAWKDFEASMRRIGR
jgi:DNA primase